MTVQAGLSDLVEDPEDRFSRVATQVIGTPREKDFPSWGFQTRSEARTNAWNLELRILWGILLHEWQKLRC